MTGTNASSAVNVTFSVVAGPGRVIASHNGDPNCHDPNLSPSHTAFHGLVRGIVQVTHDASSSAHHRRRLGQIDLDGNQRTTIAAPTEEQAQATLEAQATTISISAASPGLVAGTASIPVSANAAKFSVLAAAADSRTGSAEQLLW